MQNQQGGSQDFFEFNEMGKELDGMHQQHHRAPIAAPGGADWAMDFMQQSPLQQQHPEFHNDTQFQEFENVFRNAQLQQQPGPLAAGKTLFLFNAN